MALKLRNILIEEKAFTSATLDSFIWPQSPLHLTSESFARDSEGVGKLRPQSPLRETLSVHPTCRHQTGRTPPFTDLSFNVGILYIFVSSLFQKFDRPILKDKFVIDSSYNNS